MMRLKKEKANETHTDRAASLVRTFASFLSNHFNFLILKREKNREEFNWERKKKKKKYRRDAGLVAACSAALLISHDTTEDETTTKRNVMCAPSPPVWISISRCGALLLTYCTLIGGGDGW
jgi:hypothetical protein